MASKPANRQTAFRPTENVLVGVASNDTPGLIGDEIFQAFELLEGPERYLVVDLSQIHFFSSMDASHIFRIHNLAKRKGGVAIFCGASSTVSGILQIMRIHRMFHLMNTVESAVDLLGVPSDAATSPLSRNRLQLDTAFDKFADISINDPVAFERLLVSKSEHPVPDPTKQAEHLRALLATVPDDAGYAQLVQSLDGLARALRQQIADRLEPALNAQIRGMPQETLDQKKELARWVNTELDRLGLAVKCPKTGLPAKLRGVTGHWPGVGRFAIEIYVDGKQKTPTISDTLPEIQLIDASPVLEPETPWQEKVGPRSKRPGRKRS